MEVSSAQKQIDTRALEKAVEAYTLAVSVKGDIGRIDNHLVALRTDNTSQHDRSMTKFSEGLKTVHGRIEKIMWATILGMGSLLVLGLGIMVQIQKVVIQ